MGNEKHLAILSQGVKIWNQWRMDYPGLSPDLSEMKLSDTKLYWPGTEIEPRSLNGVDFSHTNLDSAFLGGANLSNSNLKDASLRRTNLRRAVLRNANLYRARRNQANLTLADLRGANLSYALIWETILARVNMKGTKGLASSRHGGPSLIDIRTIRKSGELPIDFLRGIGLEEWQIEALKLGKKRLSTEELNTTVYELHQILISAPTQFYSCFISYSSQDEAFARRLYRALQANSVRCWFAPEDMKTGQRVRTSIDESIRIHDKLLLILSKYSVASDWVEHEVETALEKERQMKDVVLFPIRLDDVVMEVKSGWPTQTRRRHIGDFRNWSDPEKFQVALERLLQDLRDEGEV